MIQEEKGVSKTQTSSKSFKYIKSFFYSLINGVQNYQPWIEAWIIQLDQWVAKSITK